MELSAVRKGGEEFPVEVIIAPITSDGPGMFAGYIRDITERKRAEQALRQYTQDLEAAKEAQERHAQKLTELVEQLSVAPAARKRVEQSRRCVEELLASGATLYGVNTGFGKLANERIEPQEVLPERVDHGRHGHRRTGVAGLRLLDSVHCQGANRVDAEVSDFEIGGRVRRVDVEGFRRRVRGSGERAADRCVCDFKLHRESF